MSAVTQAPSRRRPSRAARAGFHVLGIVGELLITLGLLIAGFLVWQLWWTDVVADKAQAEIVEELPWAVTAPIVPPKDVPADEIAVAQPRHDEPPAEPVPAHAQSVATLTVPRWDATAARPISEGTDRATVLDVLGIGHYEGTAMPGGIGNFAVAGHRTTYGKPFNRIDELQVGDPLVVRTALAWYVYRVTSSQIVPPHEVDVIAPVPGDPGATPSRRMITLTTCHPMFSARERYIVHGELDYWAPADGAFPAELLPAA